MSGDGPFRYRYIPPRHFLHVKTDEGDFCYETECFSIKLLVMSKKNRIFAT